MGPADQGVEVFLSLATVFRYPWFHTDNHPGRVPQYGDDFRLSGGAGIFNQLGHVLAGGCCRAGSKRTIQNGCCFKRRRCSGCILQRVGACSEAGACFFRRAHVVSPEEFSENQDWLPCMCADRLISEERAGRNGRCVQVVRRAAFDGRMPSRFVPAVRRMAPASTAVRQ